MKLFHLFVRWGLGIHGAIHVVEFFLNIVEGAWLSATFTLFAAFLMLSGAFMNYHHEQEDE